MSAYGGKKIILAITPDVKLYSCFEDNLKHLGFQVFTISYYKKFKYRNLKEKLINAYKRTFLKNRTYKKNLVRAYNNDAVMDLIAKTPPSDYSLTIRADIFAESTLQKILQLAPKNYAYQWDGLSRFPDILNLIPFFDKFYVFDKSDLTTEHKTYPATNFYFDCYAHLFEKKAPEYDFYAISNYDKRIHKIISIFEILHKKGYKLKLMLYTKPKKHLKKYSYITFIEEPISYYDNLIHVSNSKNLIDIHNNSVHNGLSFRTFEALGYHKKLITTNPNIKNYDFYNKNNIFYLDEDFNTDSIDAFLEAPFEEIDPIVKKKYSFTNWINYILETENNTAIEIP